MFPTTVAARLRRLGSAVAIVLLVLAASLFGTRAALAYVAMPETGMSGYLTLHAQPAELRFDALSPGAAGFGQVRVELANADTGRLSVQAFGSGTLFDRPDGISLITRMCDDEWADVPIGIVRGAAPAPRCASGELDVSALSESRWVTEEMPDIDVGTLVAGDPRYLLVELRMAPATGEISDTSLMGLTGDFAVRVTVAGDNPVQAPPAPVVPSGTAGPTGPLASTGVNAVSAALCGLAAIALGLAVHRRRTTAAPASAAVTAETDRAA